MENKLTREIDGHKFFSKAYATKKDAEANQRESYTAVYYGELDCWFNYGGAAGNSFQEDIHTRP